MQVGFALPLLWQHSSVNELLLVGHRHIYKATNPSISNKMMQKKNKQNYTDLKSSIAPSSKLLNKKPNRYKHASI